MLDPPQYTIYRPRRIRLRTWFLLLVGLVIAWSLSSYWAEYRHAQALIARETMAPPVGSHCVVVFRADAVGVERSGPQAISVNGTENYLSGTFDRMNDQWVVIRTAGEKACDVWIPREQIMQIEVSGP